VKPGSASELRRAINKLSQNEKIRRKMGKNARKEIEKYYWNNVIKQLEKVLRKHVRGK
jgi:glycosyltransferase involved in cell wall biosynthesis